MLKCLCCVVRFITLCRIAISWLPQSYPEGGDNIFTFQHKSLWKFILKFNFDFLLLSSLEDPKPQLDVKPLSLVLSLPYTRQANSLPYRARPQTLLNLNGETNCYSTFRICIILCVRKRNICNMQFMCRNMQEYVVCVTHTRWHPK
jgi:hypothetical protein